MKFLAPERGYEIHWEQVALPPYPPHPNPPATIPQDTYTVTFALAWELPLRGRG